MSKRKFIPAGIAFLAAVVLLAGIWFFTQPDLFFGEKTVTVTVIHSDGATRELTVTTEARTVSQVLLEEGLIAGLDPTGFYSTIDGETADYSVDQSYWSFYINGEYAATGMNDTSVVDGYHYTLEYTR